jgi:hypothetical protein
MNPGDIVYSVRGDAAEFVARSFDGYIVRQLFERDGEPHVGKPELWHEVFTTPPLAKVHEKIAAAEKRLQELNAAITAARDQQRELDATEKDRLARLKQHEALARIDDFLAGKITHYVVESWSGIGMILDRTQAISGDEDRHGYNKDTKLLTLFGKSNGDLQWRLNHYSDGSGHLIDVWPCASYEEAAQVATTRIEGEYAKWRGGDTRARLSDAAKAAAALQVSVPDDVRAHLKASAVANAKASVEQRLKELATAQAKLDEAEAA